MSSVAKALSILRSDSQNTVLVMFALPPRWPSFGTASTTWRSVAGFTCRDRQSSAVCKLAVSRLLPLLSTES